MLDRSMGHVSGLAPEGPELSTSLLKDRAADVSALLDSSGVSMATPMRTAQLLHDGGVTEVAVSEGERAKRRAEDEAPDQL